MLKWLVRRLIAGVAFSQAERNLQLQIADRLRMALCRKRPWALSIGAARGRETVL